MYRYIEMNPVRASMVTSPSDYHWSSYQINALGKLSDLCTPHPEYLKLGENKNERYKNYQTLFKHHFDAGVLKQIRNATNKCMVFGNIRFQNEIETLTGRRVWEKKRGRPKGWRKANI